MKYVGILGFFSSFCSRISNQSVYNYKGEYEIRFKKYFGVDIIRLKSSYNLGINMDVQIFKNIKVCLSAQK